MTDPTKPNGPAPLTQQELGEYLLYRYTSGGYDDHIAIWRASKQQPKTAGDAGTKQETK